MGEPLDMQISHGNFSSLLKKGALILQKGVIVTAFIGAIGIDALAIHGVVDAVNFDPAKELGKLGDIRLKRGDSLTLPYNLFDPYTGKIYYSGMQDNQNFILTLVPGGHDHQGVPLYFPSDSEQIAVKDHQFSVEEVNPDYLILKHLGYQQR